MKGLWRCHWMLANIVQSHIEGNPEFALAFACQSMKCLHQVALDQGVAGSTSAPPRGGPASSRRIWRRPRGAAGGTGIPVSAQRAEEGEVHGEGGVNYSFEASFPRLVSRVAHEIKGTPLGRFIAWLKWERQIAFSQQHQGNTEPTLGASFVNSSATHPLFPSHLPQRPLWMSNSQRPRSRRRAARWKTWRVSYGLIELAWSSLAFLSLGSPKKRSSYLERLGNYSINPRQVIAFEMLCADAIHTCRLDPRSSLALGRGTARLHRLQTLLGEISPDIACGSHIDLDSAESVALPVSVSEIIKCVPLDCGKCHPELYLKGKNRQTFLHQEHLVVSEEPFAAALPKPCYRVEESEEEKLQD